MGLFENVSEFRQRLKCRTIHLVLGITITTFAKIEMDSTIVYFSAAAEYDRVEDEQMVLCHYPLHVWQNHHRGTWHLHGHTHGKLNDPVFYQRKVMDVGIDTHPEFRYCTPLRSKGILIREDRALGF